jgi:hypothetical protein
MDVEMDLENEIMRLESAPAAADEPLALATPAPTETTAAPARVRCAFTGARGGRCQNWATAGDRCEKHRDTAATSGCRGPGGRSTKLAHIIVESPPLNVEFAIQMARTRDFGHVKPWHSYELRTLVQIFATRAAVSRKGVACRFSLDFYRECALAKEVGKNLRRR